jgi:hypothetical protein
MTVWSSLPENSHLLTSSDGKRTILNHRLRFCPKYVRQQSLFAHLWYLSHYPLIIANVWSFWYSQIWTTLNLEFCPVVSGQSWFCQIWSFERIRKNLILDQIMTEYLCRIMIYFLRTIVYHRRWENLVEGEKIKSLKMDRPGRIFETLLSGNEWTNELMSSN